MSYAKEPTVVEMKGPGGLRVNLNSGDVGFVGEDHRISDVATTEAYVRRRLDRAEFRRLRDQQKTYDAILARVR